MDIDSAFEAKDELSTAISTELAESLAPFGFTVNNVLCTESLGCLKRAYPKAFDII